MPTLMFETTINCPLEEVWAFHEDVLRALPALSPPKADVKIESADLPVAVGSRIVVLAKGPLGRIRMVAKIIEHRPPHDVAFGREARFVDEQESGPFKHWHHEHDFEAIDSKTTRNVDRVTYTVPYGILGKLGDILIARRQINAMFKHRHEVLQKLLSVAADPQPR